VTADIKAGRLTRILEKCARPARLLSLAPPSTADAPRIGCSHRGASLEILAQGWAIIRHRPQQSQQQVTPPTASLSSQRRCHRSPPHRIDRSFTTPTTADVPQAISEHLARMGSTQGPRSRFAHPGCACLRRCCWVLLVQSALTITHFTVN
jgi:hypothetical protein